MKFGRPEMLLLWFLLPALLGFFIWTGRRRRRALLRFAEERLLPGLRPAASDLRRRIKAALVLAAVFFLVLALARPQLGTSLEEVRRRGVDVAIAIDVSRSMLAQDVTPSRLERAKLIVGSILDRLAGDRVALVAFAGDAFVLCPLTLDYGAARMFLDILDPQTVPTGGTALAAAIEKAQGVFDRTERKHKVLVLITDGEGHRGDPVKAAEAAAGEGVVIHTVGIGTPNGEFIPELDDEGKLIGYKKDRAGQLVRSKLDEMTLEKVALVADGKYFRAGLEDAALDGLFAELAGMEKKDLKSQMVVRYKDRYQWALVPAILLLLAETLVSERRRAPRRIAPAAKEAAR